MCPVACYTDFICPFLLQGMQCVYRTQLLEQKQAHLTSAKKYLADAKELNNLLEMIEKIAGATKEQERDKKPPVK